MMPSYIHNQPAKDLSMFSIICDTLFSTRLTISREIQQNVLELFDTLKKPIVYIRGLESNLSPTSLDEHDLLRAVLRICEEFFSEHRVNINFYSAGMDSLNLDFVIEANIHSFICETLNNIKKHANASTVNIRILCSTSKIVVRVEDDGKGFYAEDLAIVPPREKYMGLRTMEEKVRMLEGKMKIHSRPMAGTRIFIEIPFKQSKGV